MKTTCLFHISISLMLLIFPALLSAQCNETAFRAAMHRADSCEKVGNYALAFKKYKSAIGDCPDKETVANEAIAKLFTTINEQREKAQKAIAGIVSRDLVTVEKLILSLDYNATIDILNDAAKLGEDLGDKKSSVIAALVDVGYFFTETGELKNARHVLNVAQRLAPNVGAVSLLQQAETEQDSLKKQSLLRTAIPKIDMATWQKCENRYFPQMIFIEGGTFMMGCDANRDGDCEEDETLHPVSLSDYNMSQTEVTVWQFSVYCAAKGRKLSGFTTNQWKFEGNQPIINVDWFDAADYCNWLTEMRVEKGKLRYRFGSTEGSTDFSPYKAFETVDSLARHHYRLPTEAEWEYAVRGGKKQGELHQRYSGGFSAEDSSLNKVAWWGNNSGGSVHGVGTLRANALGLYDMTGNVWEWCEDNYVKKFYTKCKEKGIVTNPIVLKSNDTKNEAVILRGGSWSDNDTDLLRVASRYFYVPSSDDDVIGFRVVLLHDF